MVQLQLTNDDLHAVDFKQSVGWWDLEKKTGKTESDVIKLMRKTLKPGSFRLWRKRVHNKSIKHRKKFQLQRKKLREKIKINDIY